MQREEDHTIHLMSVHVRSRSNLYTDKTIRNNLVRRTACHCISSQTQYSNGIMRIIQIRDQRSSLINRSGISLRKCPTGQSARH